MRWNDKPTPAEIAADKAWLNGGTARFDARLVAHAGESLAAIATYDEATKKHRAWSKRLTAAELDAAVRYAGAIRRAQTKEKTAMSGVHVPPPDAARRVAEAADIAMAADSLAGFQQPAFRSLMQAGYCGVCRGRLDRRSSNASCAHRHAGHRGDDEWSRDD